MTTGGSERQKGVSELTARVKSILFKPKDAWPEIARDPTPSGDLFTRYVMPLAAIGPVCSFLGGQIFGFGSFWFRIKPSFFGSLTSAAFSFVVSMVSVLVLTLVTSKLAPKFGGEADGRKALKLIAFAGTAAWLGGAFSLLPSLGFLGFLLVLYSLYLFYTGATPMMKVPKEKAAGFTAVACLWMVVIGLVLGSVATGAGRVVGVSPFGLFGGPGATVWSDMDDGNIRVEMPRGDVTVDTRRLEDGARQIEQAVRNGGGKAVDPAALQALLPERIGDYTRTEVESVNVGPTGSRAEGTYESGDKSFKLSVADMSGIGALAGIGAAFGIESNKESANGYERASTRDGNFIVEKWRNNSERGTYATMVGKRFFVQAEGEAESIDELKGAVASIDADELTALPDD